MKLKILGSSSSGNCYILQAGEEQLLIEAGVPFKKIQQALNFDFSKVVGCLISHEHKDHSKAVFDLIKAGIDIYCSRETAKALGIFNCHRYIAELGLQIETFKMGYFAIMAFNTQHDCEDGRGFLIGHMLTKENVLFCTDSYYIKPRFAKVNYFLIEANYCADTLQANIDAGLIPPERKLKLLQSHFSLENCKKFLAANVSSETRKIVLLHLSAQNSDGARMVKEIHDLTGIDTEIAEKGKTIELALTPY